MGGWRTARRLGLAAALVALVTIAGCMGSGGDEPLNETQTPDDQRQLATEEAANASEAELAFEGPSEQVEISETGTFTTGDGAFAGGAMRGADTREHDLTPEVPTGAPVTLNVTIQYSGETTQLNGDWLFENVQLYDTHYVKNFDTDTIWMEASLARTGTGGSVVAIVQADTSGENPEQEYSLDATITSHGEATLPGVPTAVPVTEASGGFVIQTPEDGSALATVNVWSPDGERQQLEPSAGEVRLTVEDGTVGRYVVLAAPAEDGVGVASTPLTVAAANASSPPSEPLEVVPVETRQGSWNTVSAGEPTEWTFEQDAAPIQAGLVARPTDTVSTTGPGSLDVQLASPSATLIDESLSGIYGGASEIRWTTPLAHPDLVAGTYEGQASVDEGGTDWEVAHVVRELQLPR